MRLHYTETVIFMSDASKRQTRQVNCTCMLLHFLTVLKKQRDILALVAFALLCTGKMGFEMVIYGSLQR